MINTVLVENETKSKSSLVKKIVKYCPFISISASAKTLEETQDILKQMSVDLVIIDLETFPVNSALKVVNYNSHEPELIYISKTITHAIEALQGHAAEYITKPIQNDLLLNAVERIKKRLQEKEKAKKNKLLLKKLLTERNKNQSIGIPTLEGFSFFTINEIIRCEGLQKCTRIFTTTKTDIISSYSIGQFKKLLEPYGFFTTHKSHLINLDFIKQYYREGSLILKDNSKIPVSKRRKSIFLKQVVHP